MTTTHTHGADGPLQGNPVVGADRVTSPVSHCRDVDAELAAHPRVTSLATTTRTQAQVITQAEVDANYRCSVCRGRYSQMGEPRTLRSGIDLPDNRPSRNVCRPCEREHHDSRRGQLPYHTPVRARVELVDDLRLEGTVTGRVRDGLRVVELAVRYREGAWPPFSACGTALWDHDEGVVDLDLDAEARLRMLASTREELVAVALTALTVDLRARIEEAIS